MEVGFQLGDEVRIDKKTGRIWCISASDQLCLVKFDTGEVTKWTPLSQLEVAK